MTPERWRLIVNIFHAAVQREPAEHPAFLAEACGNDDRLRSEIQAIIAAHHEAGGFGSAPLFMRSAQFEPGCSFGPYRIEGLLGAGGMGEVYRAHDSQLGRYVALKILPDAFAADSDRLARFRREAQVLASLNHPNIGVIFGFDDVAGIRALVLELVEGLTLAERIARGPLALDEALPIARQIAAALEAAHEQGVVHRDLKPANVMVRPDGAVKVLDFGLAKPMDSNGWSPNAAANVSLPGVASASPMTSAGVILGTAAYMPPEQVNGRPLDKRADIWAFGCVFYEMLTGRHAFAGAERSDILASVLTRMPDWAALPATTPTPIRRLLRRCLEKNRAQRLPDIADARLEIDEALTAPTSDSLTAAPDLPPVRPARGGGALPWVIATILASAGVLALAQRAPWRTTSPLVPQRLSVELGVDGRLSATDVPFVLSPDGSLLAFAAVTVSRAPQLYVRRLDQLTATPLSGTDGASSPFFSPDGQWLGFFADFKLKKIPVTGGAVVTLADARNPRGGWWAEDGTIVFAPNNRVSLLRVSAVGGQAEPVTTLMENERTHRFPQVLPGGVAVLYTASTQVNIGADATLVVQPLPSGERTIIQRGGYFGRYVSSGHILYAQDGTLFAMPFDARRLTVTGPAGRAIDGVRSDASRGVAQFAVSPMGMLAYLPGRNLFDPRPIVWMDLAGNLVPLRSAPAFWSNPEFSPDGERIAMEIKAGGHSDIWVYEWARDVLTRVTSDATNEERPVWTPDGERLVYRSFRSLTTPADDTLSWKRADGTGDAQVLIHSNTALLPGSWHPNGKLLAYVSTSPSTDDDIMVLPVEGDEAAGWKPGQPKAFLDSAAIERLPVFSPDGKWIAYQSTESGTDGVHVRPFPGPGGRVTLASIRSEQPSWSRTRPELVFTAGTVDHTTDYTRILMVAPYRVEDGAFQADKPRPWAGREFIRFVQGDRNYAMHPDGVRVAMAPLSAGEGVGQNHLTLVLHFFDELRRIASSTP